MVGREPGADAGLEEGFGSSPPGGAGSFKAVSPSGILVESDLKLSRSLGFWHYVAINIGAIIGAGWLLSPLGAAAFDGTLSIASWVVASALVVFMALAYAYLAGLMPRTGAVVRYPQAAHGDLVGFSVGALYLLSIASLMPAEAVAVVSYASYYVPGLVRVATVLGQQVDVLTPKGMLLTLAIVAVIFLINYYGVKLVGGVSLALMVWKIAVPALVIASLLALAFDAHNLMLGGVTEASASNLSGAAAVLAAIPLTGIMYSLLGFRQAVEYGGEGRSSSKDVPKAVAASVALSAALFILLQVAFIGALRWSEVHPVETLPNGTTIVLSNVSVSPGNWTALARSNIAAAPLASELAIVGLGALSVLMIVDAWVSPLGNAIIQMGNLGRIVYGMAANGHLPRSFRSLNRYAVPGLGLAVALALGIAFLIPFPSWYAIGGFAVLTTLLTYVTGGTSLGAMLRGRRGFAAKAVAAAGAIAAAILAYWAGLIAMVPVFMAFVSVLAAYLLIRAADSGSPLLLGVSAAYAVAAVVVDYILATSVFYPLSSGLSVTPGSVIIALLAALVISTVSATAALAGFDLLGDLNTRSSIRSGYWYVFLVFAIFAVDAFGPYGLPSVFGDVRGLPFPLDLVAVVAVAAAAYAMSVRLSVAGKGEESGGPGGI